MSLVFFVLVFIRLDQLARIRPREKNFFRIFRSDWCGFFFSTSGSWFSPFPGAANQRRRFPEGETPMCASPIPSEWKIYFSRKIFAREISSDFLPAPWSDFFVSAYMIYRKKNKKPPWAILGGLLFFGKCINNPS